MGEDQQMSEELSTPTRLEDLIGYNLRRASLIDLQGATAALEQAGTRVIPMCVLSTVIERPGVTSAEVCRLLGMQRANMVPILAELEAKDLVSREADPLDQRVQKIFATEQGLEQGQQWLALLAEHERKLLSRFSEKERGDLLKLLSKLWQETD